MEVDRPQDIKRIVAIALMEVQPREIQRYITPNGQIPFDDWFYALKDSQAKLKINVRLKRVSTGNFGDCRSVGEGVWELRFNFGPGYRVYFGQVETTIVLLLCGGDKSTQDEDIRKAKKYWNKYRSQDNG